MRIFFGLKNGRDYQNLLAIAVPIAFYISSIPSARSEEILKVRDRTFGQRVDRKDFRNRASFIATDPIPNSSRNPIPEQQELPALPERLPTLSNPQPRLIPKSYISPNTTVPLDARVRVRRVEVLGSTAFSPSDFLQVTTPFLSKDLTIEQLLGIRAAITKLYTSRGYATSGAFIPPQDITSGTLRVQVIEGVLERVEIRGLERLRDRYVRSRFKAATKSPLDIRKLESALQLLQQNDLIAQVQARLTVGTAPGRSILSIDIKEAPPFAVRLTFDNRESPSVGSLGGYTSINYDNLIGVGDRLGAAIALTQGVTSYDFSYEVPLNSKDGKLRLRYANGRNRVVEQPFAPLDIKGKSQTYSLGFSQPLFRTPNSEFTLGLSLDLRRSRTFLFDDEPYSFTTGPERGESKVSVLRFSQDWIKRSRQVALAARSQFSLGIDALGATINDSGTDGRFFSWLGQFQLVKALNQKRDSTFVARAAAQLTGDSLLPLEQISIGGVDTVRGYRSNSQVGDSGITGSLELQLPVARDSDGFGVLQIVPFVDAGVTWSNGELATTNPNTLVSTGLGLRWQLNSRFAARADWGIPLVTVGDRDGSLQDNGLNFSIQWQPF